jgi:hypothetical protein
VTYPHAGLDQAISERHGGQLAGAKVEGEPFQRGETRVDVHDPLVLLDDGYIIPASSAFSAKSTFSGMSRVI